MYFPYLIKKSKFIIETQIKINNIIKNEYGIINLGCQDENHITTEILKELALRGKSFEFNNNQCASWKIHKLKGKNESQFGDILFFISIELESSTLNGVVFYEAKKMESNHIFTSIKKDQIEKIQTQTTASNYLFYCIKNDSKSNECEALTLSTILVERLYEENKKTEKKLNRVNFSKSIEKYGRPWFEVLVENLQGLGIDYSEHAVSTMRKLVGSEKRPTYIINATLSELGKDIPQGLDIPLEYHEILNECSKDNITFPPILNI